MYRNKNTRSSCQKLQNKGKKLKQKLKDTQNRVWTCTNKADMAEKENGPDNHRTCRGKIQRTVVDRKILPQTDQVALTE